MYVFALQSAVIGRGQSVSKGEIRYASDPLVLAHPGLFSSTPPPDVVRRSPGWSPDVPVEQASAAPGEKRIVKRGG